jgi:hypothetical protein
MQIFGILQLLMLVDGGDEVDGAETPTAKRPS